MDEMPKRVEAGMSAKDMWGASDAEIARIKNKKHSENKLKGYNKTQVFIETPNKEWKAPKEIERTKIFSCWKCRKEKCFKCGEVIKELGRWDFKIEKFTCFKCVKKEYDNRVNQ